MKNKPIKTVINIVALCIFLCGVIIGIGEAPLVLRENAAETITKKTLITSMGGNTQTFDILSYHENEYGMLKIKTKEGPYLYLDKQNVLIKEEITAEKSKGKEKEKENASYKLLLSATCLVGGFCVIVCINWEHEEKTSSNKIFQ